MNEERLECVVHECGHALCLQGCGRAKCLRERERGGEREKEIEKERGREGERE